ncbi:branched-chain amino acid aminotransferase [Allocatelliglobosispora scoriae]|uniref:Branched-chain-amino-acid aminotransferase n=1 Tax=Allocatelliglobosispora scoriae TaxID=643052 RepID=A0A841C176_9ACTN|nr:branched-chain amino acid aminotransferase [Allocatelliglobosispora scoriae]MBB5872720.1 branched-chain amino acid aminotransferase [Allocatelliglobosispora scoriae]
MTTLVDTRPSKVMANPGHGDAFTDHMVTAHWTRADGWTVPQLGPLVNLSMHPGMIGLHYAQVVFEGLKAFVQADGSIAAFRPRDNAARFARSAARLAMPEVPASMFLSAVEEVVRADADWLLDNPQHTLYLRPLLYASEAQLMLRASNEYTFLMMAFLAGGFFGDQVDPVSVLVSRDFTRAVPGGTGNVKCAANYGPSLLAQRQAQEAGCQQVVWLDAAEHRFIEEMGGMNLFFVRGSGADARLVTPELTGTLLPGMTRNSLLTIAAREGYAVSEERITVDEWRDQCLSGAITETFACGTAAVVTPVGRVRDRDGDFMIGTGTMGAVTRRLRAALLDVQHGRTADPAGWLHPITI